jgi:ankyrin repeat protein
LASLSKGSDRQAGPDITYLASELGLYGLFKAQIRAGEISNTESSLYRNPLQAAAVNEHEKIFQLLLDHGADLNLQGGLLGSALVAAANGGYERILGLLLDHGADVNLPGGLLNVHALLSAASEGHERIVELLLDRGTDVNLREGYREGALAAATYKGYKNSQAFA